MKHEWKFYGSFLIAFMLTACEALGVAPQATVPVQTVSRAVHTSTQGQITYPQMTQTAQAFPTTVYPTEKPLMPQELFDLSQWKAISPNGNFVITCDYTFPTLFYAPTKTVIATVEGLIFRCENAVFWSPDNSYAFIVAFDPNGTLYRWRVDGSQPEMVSLNMPPNQTGSICDAKFIWSSDTQYIAIEKGCNGLYVVKAGDEASFGNPLLVEACNGCFYDFRWATPSVLIVEYFKAAAFVHVPSGNDLGSVNTSGGICAEQIPFISPDEHWMTFDVPWCGGGDRGPNQSAIAKLEDGSEKIFSESFADRIDFVGWSQDGSTLYFVSRPTELHALPDPRTPFGLLAMNPETLQIQNLFEQAWFVSFDEDFHWAYVVFPSKNEDGSLDLEGGLWQMGTSQLMGRQIMANDLDEKFLEPVAYFGVQSFYSANGQELGSSTTAIIRPIPAVWSHDNRRVAVINSAHQLVVMNQNGDVKTVGQLKDSQEWLYSQIIWSDDNKVLDVDGVQWTVP